MVGSKKAKAEEMAQKVEIAEETGHKAPAAVVEKEKKLPTLVYSKAKGVWYGSRELWEKIFENANMPEEGKLEVVEISFPTAPDMSQDERIVHLRLKKK